MNADSGELNTESFGLNANCSDFFIVVMTFRSMFFSVTGAQPAQSNPPALRPPDTVPTFGALLRPVYSSALIPSFPKERRKVVYSN